MSSQQNMPNSANMSLSQPKNAHVNNLMKSIQNKLSMLACENSIDDFQQSKLESPKREFLTATNEKKKNNRITLQDLETSNHKQYRQHNSLGQSRIVQRINQIQHFYMDKIQSMATRMSHLQFDLQTVNKMNSQLLLENKILKQNISKYERQQNDIINNKIDQFKKQLIQKFSKQAQQHYSQHIKQIHSITEQLLQQKGKVKYFQQQISLLRNQKNNLQEFYKNLLQNHRNLIKYDISRSEKMVKEQHSNDYSIINKGQQQTAKNTVKKMKKKDKSTISKKSQQMSKEQMIPFLAKGIQQLKDKLKMK